MIKDETAMKYISNWYYDIFTYSHHIVYLQSASRYYPGSLDEYARNEN